MFKKAFYTNSSGILVSRIFGFLRDLFMAGTLGASVYSDIFFIAFKLPNLFRRIFSEGSFTQSFLPSFVAAKRKAAFSVFIFLIFLIFLIVFSLIVWEFSGIFTQLLASGFSKETILLAKPIVAINFWYLSLIFCVSYFSALLQYKNNFWVSSYNTVLLNIFMILALFISKDKDLYTIVYFLSYGVLVGGVAQIALHCYSLYKLKFFLLFCAGLRELYLIFFKKNISRARELKKSATLFFKQFFPSLLGSSTAQIASFIDTVIASYLAAGSVSYLYYANRIFQLPLAIFAIATSTALFPMVAKIIKTGDENRALELLKKPFWLLVFSLSFCTLGGAIFRNEIIWLLYEHGKFIRSDTIVVANVFMCYMVGLIPFGLSRIFSLWLYSNHAQGKAAKISAISLFFGIIFSLILMKPLGAIGLAIASSFSGFVLLFLTIYEFGSRKFMLILNNKKVLLSFIMFLCISGVVFLFIKKIFHMIFNIGSF